MLTDSSDNNENVLEKNKKFHPKTIQTYQDVTTEILDNTSYQHNTIPSTKI